MKMTHRSKFISEKRFKQSWRDGNIAATRYKRACPDARKSNEYEDINLHVDFWHEHVTLEGEIRDDGVDVKGNNLPDEIWVEFTNVLGKPGWTKGEARWIAFEMCEVGGFVRVERKELLDWCYENVSPEQVTQKQKAYKKIYQRVGRKDKITKLILEDLKELNSYSVIPYCLEYFTPEGELNKI
tara:strand:- start:26 stop:577 length:552 start_codon:yes stop_codon:yes gene_type:complete